MIRHLPHNARICSDALPQTAVNKLVPPELIRLIEGPFGRPHVQKGPLPRRSRSRCRRSHLLRVSDRGPLTSDLGPWTLDLGPTSSLEPWTLDLGAWPHRCQRRCRQCRWCCHPLYCRHTFYRPSNKRCRQSRLQGFQQWHSHRCLGLVSTAKGCLVATAFVEHGLEQSKCEAYAGIVAGGSHDRGAVVCRPTAAAKDKHKSLSQNGCGPRCVPPER